MEAIVLYINWIKTKKPTCVGFFYIYLKFKNRIMTKDVAQKLVDSCSNYVGKTLKCKFENTDKKILKLKVVELSLSENKDLIFEAICVFEENEKGIVWSNLKDVQFSVEISKNCELI